MDNALYIYVYYLQTAVLTIIRYLKSVKWLVAFDINGLDFENLDWGLWEIYCLNFWHSFFGI